MKKLYLAILGLGCGLILGGYGTPAFALPSQCTPYCTCNTTVDPHVCTGPSAVQQSVNRGTVNPASPTVPPAPLSKVGPLSTITIDQYYTIIARELPSAESPSVAANRKKKCEDAGGSWVGGTLIIGQQANAGLGGIQYIPGYCKAAAATTPQ